MSCILVLIRLIVTLNLASLHLCRQDVRAVQKRLNEAQEQIVWVNKEEALYKYPISLFTEVEEIGTAVEPFQRLFQVIFKWQRAEKK